MKQQHEFSHRIGNSLAFDKRWRHNRLRNKLARASRKRNRR
jgi:hypothetical protein